ncbi:crotonase/enoyl-CoA hydratase family protein [Neobacillus sp. C211]|uniref:crotonase/enoyl-CoA hydratase family protein n=1 Tax=unclassified Neobacillus TaxID=2675272 RepID=UPI003978E600
MEFNNIKVENDGRIFIITINRPEAMNAINQETWIEIGESIEFFNRSNEYVVAILTGAGNRSFCAGADLKALSRGESIIPSSDEANWGFAGIVKHYTNKPIIAAVNGFALGGGTEIALACDIVIASENATFGLPEVKRGIIAGAGGLLRLPRQIPLKIASELIFTGDTLSADAAAKWGLVNHVVPHELVIDKAIEVAKKIADNAPVAVRASKDIVYKGLDVPIDHPQTGWDINDQYVAVVMESEDSLEGPRAFAEKRQPVWKGK